MNDKTTCAAASAANAFDEAPVLPQKDSFWVRHWKDLILVPLTFVVVMAIWQVVSGTKVVNPIILPPPSDIARSFWDVTSAEWFPPHLYTTALEMVLGFLIGTVLGVVLGIMLANLQLFRRLAYPYIITFQVMPKVVLAPIFLTWFGLGMNSKIVTSAAICFFPVVVNTLLGLESLEENSVLLMRSLVATKWQMFTKVAFPNALPAIFAGIETAATIALIGALVAEFVTARQGLGLLLTTFNMELKIGMVFGVILWVSILGLLLYGVVEFAKYKVVFWQHDWNKEIG
jgi:NitT/TauT family transport system permease protein